MHSKLSLTNWFCMEIPFYFLILQDFQNWGMYINSLFYKVENTWKRSTVHQTEGRPFKRFTKKVRKLNFNLRPTLMLLASSFQCLFACQFLIFCYRPVMFSLKPNRTFL